MKYKLQRPYKKPGQSARAKKAHVLADEIGLSADERHELARMLPSIDSDTGGSWKDLDEKQYHDMLTMMEGFLLLTYQMMQRTES